MKKNYGVTIFFHWFFFLSCPCVAASDERILECRQEGRFPHPQDCGSYVDCLRTAGGELLAREGHCHGYPFSAEKRRCVHHSERPDCVIKGTRIAFPAPDFNFACAVDEFAAGCLNCNLAFTCIKGNATIDICDSSSICDTSPLFGGSVCLPPASVTNSPCECSSIGLVKDPFNATYFHFCDSNTKIPETFACERGSEFNNETKKCEASSSIPPQVPPCEGKTGSFVNPNDCSWSYTCIPGGIVRNSHCSSEKYFNETSGACVEKCAFGKVAEVNPCTVLGLSPHPNDCTKYLSCKEVGKLPEEVACYPGFFYNNDKKRCSETSPPTGCKKGFDYLTCPGHKEACPWAPRCHSDEDWFD